MLLHNTHTYKEDLSAIITHYFRLIDYIHNEKYPIIIYSS